MAAKQVLDIKVLNCGGLRDLMSEMESSFLVSALGLFRNRQDLGRGTPRATVNLLRAYNADGFYDAAFGPADLLHLIAHANGVELDVGVAKKRVKASDLAAADAKRGTTFPPVVVSTGCKVQSTEWQKGLKAAGAQVLIASRGDVTPATLTAFDMSFYSALLTQVRKGTDTSIASRRPLNWRSVTTATFTPLVRTTPSSRWSICSHAGHAPRRLGGSEVRGLSLWTEGVAQTLR